MSTTETKERATDTQRLDWLQRHAGNVDYCPSSQSGEWWVGAEGRYPVRARSLRAAIDKIMKQPKVNP